MTSPEVTVAVLDPGEDLSAVVASVPGATDRLLVVACRPGVDAVAAAVRAGATGVLARESLTPQRLAEAVAGVARGEVVVPPEVLGQLFGRDRREVAAGRSPLPPSHVDDREQAVLRLLADGADTRQISHDLRYSERTVKTVIQDITRRFGLRNRAHAAAWAVRNGLA